MTVGSPVPEDKIMLHRVSERASPVWPSLPLLLPSLTPLINPPPRQHTHVWPCVFHMHMLVFIFMLFYKMHAEHGVSFCCLAYSYPSFKTQLDPSLCFLLTVIPSLLCTPVVFSAQSGQFGILNLLHFNKLIFHICLSVRGCELLFGSDSV